MSVCYATEAIQLEIIIRIDFDDIWQKYSKYSLNTLTVLSVPKIIVTGH